MKKNNRPTNEEKENVARSSEESENVSSGNQSLRVQRNLSEFNTLLYGFNNLSLPEIRHNLDLGNSPDQNLQTPFGYHVFPLVRFSERLRMMLLQRRINVPVMSLAEPPVDPQLPISVPYKNIFLQIGYSTQLARLWSRPTSPSQLREFPTYSDATLNRMLNPSRNVVYRATSRFEQIFFPQHRAMTSRKSRGGSVYPNFQFNCSSVSQQNFLREASSSFGNVQYPKISTPSPSSHLLNMVEIMRRPHKIPPTHSRSIDKFPVNLEEKLRQPTDFPNSSVSPPRNIPTNRFLEILGIRTAHAPPPPPIEPITPPPRNEITDRVDITLTLSDSESYSSMPSLETPTPPLEVENVSSESSMPSLEPVTPPSLTGSSELEAESPSRSSSSPVKRKASSESQMEPVQKAQHTRDSPQPSGISTSQSDNQSRLAENPQDSSNLHLSPLSYVPPENKSTSVYQVHKNIPVLVKYVVASNRTDKPNRVPPAEFIKILTDTLVVPKQQTKTFAQEYQRYLEKSSNTLRYSGSFSRSSEQLDNEPRVSSATIGSEQPKNQGIASNISRSSTRTLEQRKMFPDQFRDDTVVTTLDRAVQRPIVTSSEPSIRQSVVTSMPSSSQYILEERRIFPNQLRDDSVVTPLDRADQQPITIQRSEHSGGQGTVTNISRPPYVLEQRRTFADQMRDDSVVIPLDRAEQQPIAKSFGHSGSQGVVTNISRPLYIPEQRRTFSDQLRDDSVVIPLDRAEQQPFTVKHFGYSGSQGVVTNIARHPPYSLAQQYDVVVPTLDRTGQSDSQRVNTNTCTLEQRRIFPDQLRQDSVAVPQDIPKQHLISLQSRSQGVFTNISRPSPHFVESSQTYSDSVVRMVDRFQQRPISRAPSFTQSMHRYPPTPFDLASSCSQSQRYPNQLRSDSAPLDRAEQRIVQSLNPAVARDPINFLQMTGLAMPIRNIPNNNYILSGDNFVRTPTSCSFDRVTQRPATATAAIQFDNQAVLNEGSSTSVSTGYHEQPHSMGTGNNMYSFQYGMSNNEINHNVMSHNTFSETSGFYSSGWLPSQQFAPPSYFAQTSTSQPEQNYAAQYPSFGFTDTSHPLPSRTQCQNPAITHYPVTMTTESGSYRSNFTQFGQVSTHASSNQHYRYPEPKDLLFTVPNLSNYANPDGPYSTYTMPKEANEEHAFFSGSTNPGHSACYVTDTNIPRTNITSNNIDSSKVRLQRTAGYRSLPMALQRGDNIFQQNSSEQQVSSTVDVERAYENTRSRVVVETSSASFSPTYYSAPSTGLDQPLPNKFSHFMLQPPLSTPLNLTSETRTTSSGNITVLDDLRNKTSSEQKFAALKKEYNICRHLTDSRIQFLRQLTGLNGLQISSWFAIRMERDNRTRPRDDPLNTCSDCIIHVSITKQCKSKHPQKKNSRQ